MFEANFHILSSLTSQNSMLSTQEPEWASGLVQNEHAASITSPKNL